MKTPFLQNANITKQHNKTYRSPTKLWRGLRAQRQRRQLNKKTHKKKKQKKAKDKGTAMLKYIN